MPRPSLRVFLVGLILFLPACTMQAANDVTTTHICETNPLGLVECYERE